MELAPDGGDWAAPLRLEFPLGGGTAGMILQNRDHLRAVLAELKGVVVINFTNASAVLDRRPAPRRDCHD